MTHDILEKIALTLKDKAKTIGIAESCTGGLLGGKLTDIPGSSEYFNLGVITYSNEAKIKLLNVSSNTLEKYGAVSRQAAVEMAEGICRLSGSEYGIATTGIAGPGGGSALKPVGLVYLGFCSPEITKWKQLNLKGSRESIRAASVEGALKFIYDELKKDKQ